MSKKKEIIVASSGGIGLTGLLALFFVIAKVLELGIAPTLSWWWLAGILFIGPAIALFFILVGMIGAGIMIWMAER